MNIKINIVPHQSQRYPTVGDWFTDPNGDLVINVSRLSDWRREILIAVHELVEFAICKHDGVTQESVDRFDTDFEKSRHPDNTDEPGDDPQSPYCIQHCLATGIERILAAQLHVSWKDYEKELESL